MDKEELKLHLVVREDGDNLFVRLSTKVVADLMRIASKHAKPPANQRCWNAHEGNLQFLPILIEVNGEQILSSFNGGLLQNHDMIEVPRSLLKKFSTLPNEVDVTALPWIEHCSQVLIDPVTVEDWELFEMWSSSLENGLLLQQLSTVYTGQVLALRLGEDEVSGTVTEVHTSNRSIWPTMDTGLHNKTYALLMRNTEVIVTPKPRPQDPTESETVAQLIPCKNDMSVAMRHLSAQVNSVFLDADPGCVVLNQDVWPEEVEWAIISSMGNESYTQVVRVKRSNHISKQHAALHPWIREELGLQPFWSRIVLEEAPVPKLLNHSDLLLIEVQIPKDQCPAPWTEPRISCKDNAPPKVQQDDTTMSWTIPVGSWFRLSPSPGTTADDQTSEKIYRLATKEKVNHKTARRINCVESQEIAKMMSTVKSEEPRIVVPVGDFEDVPTSHTLNWLPEFWASTLDWASTIVDDIEMDEMSFLSIFGEKGSGKTHSAIMIAALSRIKHKRATLYLDCKHLKESKTRMSDILAELDKVFRIAPNAQSPLIILDGADHIAPNLFGEDGEDSSSKLYGLNPTEADQAKLISDCILNFYEACKESMSHDCRSISLLMTSTSKESIHNSLMEFCNLHGKSYSVPSLGRKEKLEILKEIVTSRLNMEVNLGSQIPGHQLDNLRPSDLERISCRACVRFETSNEEITFDNALTAVFHDYVPISQINAAPTSSLSIKTWSEIGGLFQAKVKLQTTIMDPTRYRLIYEHAEMKLPRGVLLFGPPGCGKSVLAPALANECKFPIISCKGPEVLDKYIGASEAKVRELFNQATAVAPSILFLDELDALAPRRGSDHTGVTDRVVNQLLTFLDGVEDTSSSPVYVIGATSRPDKVDPAILRPGRLEQHIFVGPPDADEEFSDLVLKIGSGWCLTNDCKEYISSHLETDDVLLNARNRLTPADIKAVFDTAHLRAVHRELKSKRAEDIHTVEIGKADLRHAFSRTQPCLTKADADTLQEVYDSFRGLVKTVRTDHLRDLKTTLW